MNFGLKSKKAIVSGSTAGIGLAIATALADKGAHVMINSRTQARVDTALEKIRQHNKSADIYGVTSDLGTTAEVEAFIQ